MKFENITGARTLGRVALSLAAVVALNCAAGEPTGGPQTASLAGPAQVGGDGWEQKCSRGAVPDSLVGPDGHDFRLAYAPGRGCRYVVGGSDEIVVDAPNGYVFALSRGGWTIRSAAD